MAEFNLSDLEQISLSREIIDLLVEKGIIKEKKFLKQLAYEKELDLLQTEMLRLQEQLIQDKKRLLLIFEGRDAAGKGGAIARTISKMNPKNYRVTVLSKPTENEKKQWYFQRYIEHLPMKGEVVLFDRSWYNRAAVEPVFGFCTEAEYQSFMKQVLAFEQLLVDDGIVLMKFFLNISKKEQFKRLESRKKDPLKQYKLGVLDQQAQEKWNDYSFYIDKMLNSTHLPNVPWVEITTDDKNKARLEVMKYILRNFEDFEPSVKLGKNKKSIVRIIKDKL